MGNGIKMKKSAILQIVPSKKNKQHKKEYLFGIIRDESNKYQGTEIDKCLEFVEELRDKAENTT